MTSKTFYAFRHGETLFSKDDIDYGDKKLTEPILLNAKPVIVRLANYLKDIKTDINLRSDVYRCKQTTDIITPISNKGFSEDKRLTEYYQESFDELRDRVDGFLKSIEETDEEIFCLCTHGAVISAMKHLLLENKFELDDLHDYPQTGVIWIFKNGQVEEVSFREK